MSQLTQNIYKADIQKPSRTFQDAAHDLYSSIPSLASSRISHPPYRPSRRGCVMQKTYEVQPTTFVDDLGLILSFSTMHGNDPDTLETQKLRNLMSKQHMRSTPFSNAPGWNETLASESEADVKADRSDPVSTVELQEQTIEYVSSRYNPDDGMGPASTNAQYSREELRGPLSHARGHADSQEVCQTVIKKVKKKTVAEGESTE